MSQFQVDVDDSAMVAKLRAMSKAATAKEPLHRAIGADLVTLVQLGFKSGRSPYGSIWPKPKFRNGQPLRDTGRLNRSITQAADAAGVTVGTSVRYARIQNYGGTIVPKNAKRLVFPNGAGGLVFAKKVTIPARRFMPLTDAGRVVLPPSWEKSVVNRVRRYIAAAGGA